MESPQTPPNPEQKQFVLPERNPVTHAAHRREVLWQVTVPLAIGCLLLVAGVVGVILAAVGANQDISRWSDVSMIWLFLPVLPVALFILIIVIGLAYGVTAILGVLPGYARLVQDYFILFEMKVKVFAASIVEPVLKVRAWQAGWLRARKSIGEQAQELRGKRDMVP
ncbi:MAG: hypothetical protein JW726_00645 [Anaerolineales bacterium]|nr:hypothetical protein [Anaerolineales bacterium]